METKILWSNSKYAFPVVTRIAVFSYGKRPSGRRSHLPPFFLESHPFRKDLYHVVGTFPDGQVSEAAVPGNAPSQFYGWKGKEEALRLAALFNQLHKEKLIDWTGNVPAFRTPPEEQDELVAELLIRRRISERILAKVKKS